MPFNLDAVVFTATSGGTGSFTVSAALTGYRTPAAAGAVDARTYRYRAQSNDLVQWEIGTATASSSGTVFSRTVLFSSTGGTVNFTNPPTVAITITAADILQFEESMSLTANQKAQGRANLGVLNKNYIINGAMMVSQENGTTALTATAKYPVDQFRVEFSNAGAISFAQVASVTPGGSPNRLRVTVTTADASVAAGDYCYIAQPIEGLRVADLRSGSASAKTVTVQFGCKGPAGTYCVSIRNSAANRSYVAEFSISGGEANTDVVKSVVIALDQSGTWLTDTGVGMYLTLDLMGGSTFQTSANAWAAGNFFATSSQFNFMGTNSNVFELFDVSMSQGAVAPEFQVPDFADELELCKRHWRKSYDYATAPAAVTTAGAFAFYLDNLSSAFHSVTMQVLFGTSMRTTPTMVSYSTATGATGKVRDAAAAADVNANISGQGQSGFANGCTSSAATTAMNMLFHWTADSRL